VILIKKGLISERDLLEALARQYNLPFEEEIAFVDNEGILRTLPVSFLKKNRLVPYSIEETTIYVATSDVLHIQPLDDLRVYFPDYEIRQVLTFDSEIDRVISGNFDISESETTDDLIEDLEESDFEILTGDVTETQDLLDMANEAPIIRLVNNIIRQAVNDGASDVHFEPFEKEIKVRFRVDGMLHQMYTPPKKYQGAIISRIKIMANLNIAENRLPQDGRIQLKVGGRDIDIRVSIFPTQFGERIVLRILNKTEMSFEMDNLGLRDETLKAFRKSITQTSGIILVTGPTGSGKSTTLYSVLTEVNEEEVNILTVEDPVEYQIEGIGQMQIKPRIGLTFATGLRSILRQDPDVVMIGEIRDTETAEIAVQAALTGHRVFSTLHTNDAATGITRLLDMGVEPYLIASSVNAFVAQRLVRRICPRCKENYKPPAALLKEIGLTSKDLKGGKLSRGKGCAHCFQSGYRGRIGIYEFLPLDDAVRRLIMQEKDAPVIKEQAISEGMKTLRDDGLSKAIDGITTVEEVLRVV
jgi:general secretion pathway protein E